jgi:hypothetical protein
MPDVQAFAVTSSKDGQASLARAVARLEAGEESQESAVKIIEAMIPELADELAAAAAIDIDLSVPIAASLLQAYLYRWANGGRVATLRLTDIVDPSHLSAGRDERTLLHWIWRSGETLALFDGELGSLGSQPAEELDASAAQTAQAFRRLSRVLRSMNALEDALACALSAVNLAMWSKEARDCVDLALELAAACGDAQISLFLKTRQADVLVRRCAADPRLAPAAFDAVESVVRHLSDLPEQRKELLGQLGGSLNASQILVGIRPLLRAATLPPTGDDVIDTLAHLLSSARWEVPWSRLTQLVERLSVLAIGLENARGRLEPTTEPAGASTRWATWAFEYPPFRRAVPYGPSLRRDPDLDELFLTVAHETIHVLSMLSGLGHAVTALRLALLEIEFRLWTFAGPADPEALTSIGVAPLVNGDLTALAQAEAGLEISRKLQILQDVWGPWLEGIAVFGEIGASSLSDLFSSPVVLVLANMIDEGPIQQAAAEEGVSVESIIVRRYAQADEMFATAGHNQGYARLRTMLSVYPAKYFAGYLAVRAVVSSWRTTYRGQISAQMAFRVLLHVTRFGATEAIPDLALSASDFRRDALAGLDKWVTNLACISAEDLDEFSQPSEGDAPMEWQGARLVRTQRTAEEHGEETHTILIERCSRALLTLSGSEADLDRVPDSDEETHALLKGAAEALTLQSFDLDKLDRDPWFVDRVLGRAAMMPIGRVRSPFWLVPESGHLVVLLRTTDRAPEHGEPLHQMIAAQLSEEQVSALEGEMGIRRDSRMLVARMANLREADQSDEAGVPGANYLVFSYGDWIHVQPRGIAEGAPLRSSKITQSARERIQPDPILDFESDLTAEGRAGATRTSSWIDSVETWTAGSNEYYAGKWASRVSQLASEVLDRESHQETHAASTVLLSAVLGAGCPIGLGERGLELLRPLDPTWIGEVAGVFAASADGPIGSPFLDTHGGLVSETIGQLFVHSEEGWDVRPINREA